MHHINIDVLETVVQSLCERINTPRALSVWLCLKYDHQALLELSATDIATNDTDVFKLDYFISEYLSKYKGLRPSWNTSKVALDRWISAEQQCKETNLKFRGYRLRPFTGRVESALFRAQRKIAAVLGPLRTPIVLADCKWGPGSTFDLRRSSATPDKKMSQVISCTISALPYLRAVIETDPHWASCFTGVIPWGAFSLLPSTVKIVRGSRLLTVPKSAKTDRVIAAEPTGNSFLQQGVHSYLRGRLRRFGVNLDDQSINQNAARDAYAHGLSTLDLSAASDTISHELLYHLLPLDWAIFLDALRSPETQVKGEWILTEKFASMGNAFCFELETLIFWALSCSVDELQPKAAGSVDKVIVYGDDIIIPRAAYDSVVEILTFCGFTINETKSYRTGNFFESCGKHYHRGIDVTPVYQKEELKSPSELIRAHNRLLRLVHRLGVDQRLVSASLRVVASSYPLRPFPRIPYGCSEDGGFLRPLSEFSLDPNHGYKCRVLDFVPRYSEGREDAMYAYKLRRFSKHALTLRDEWLGLSAFNRPSNALSSGHAANTTEGTWRTKVRYVPERIVLGNKDEPALTVL